MCCHVKQEEILLLCRQNALLYQILGKAFTNVLQLVPQFQRVPSFTCREKLIIETGFQLIRKRIKINKPLRYSIQFWTVSGGSVSLTCLRASSSKTSPVGESFLRRIFLPRSDLFLMPPFSSSTRPLRPNSMRMQPLSPLDMQSFQNDV